MSRPSRFFAVPCFAAALSCVAADTAMAQFMGRTAEDVVEVSILEGWRLPDGTHMAALSIRLAPGWKTYWRAPGEGGVPTVLALQPTDAVGDTAIHWPAPEVFFTNGMRSIGYRDDVILPIQLDVMDAGDISISGEVFMGVCLEVCMPISVAFDAVLPPSSERDTAISAALADRPLTADEAGAAQPRCRVEPIADGLQVTAEIAVRDTGNDETVIVEHADPMIWVSDSRTWRSGEMLYGTVDLVPADSGPFALNRSELRVTVVGSHMTVDLGACRG